MSTDRDPAKVVRPEDLPPEQRALIDPAYTPADDPGESDSVPRPRLWLATELDESSPVEWLAKRRLPKKAVTILVGDEGIGKSLLWVWLVGAITTGRPLPEFGIPARQPGRVLLVLTEDDWASTVRPRLELAGADLGNIVVICEEKGGSGSPIFPRDMHLVRECPAVELIVLDAFLDTVSPGLSMRDPQQARLALHPWRETALDTGAAVLLVTHTNRLDTKNARDKYGISAELRKKARLTLYAQRDDEDRLVVGPEKSNIAGSVPASMFTIDAVQAFAATEDTDGTVPRLRYLGESAKSAGEVVAEIYDNQHSADAGDRTEAEQWLEDYLTAHGSSASQAAKKDGAKALGVSERTISNAAKSLGVVFKSEGFPRVTHWSLPGQSCNDASRVSEQFHDCATGDDKVKQSFMTGSSEQSCNAQTDGKPGCTTNKPGLCRVCGLELTDPSSDTHMWCDPEAVTR